VVAGSATFGSTTNINIKITTTATRTRTKNFVEEKSKAVMKRLIKNIMNQKLPYQAIGIGAKS
jgi:hypothetical protein